MKKLLRFLFYSYQKKKLLVQSLFLIWIIRISLWLFSFNSLNKWLACYLGSYNLDNQQADWVAIDNIVKSVRVCSRYVLYASCLTQALATRTLLQMKGQRSYLKIGVKKNENEKFAAHAWVEIEGRIIIGKHPYHHFYRVLESVESAVL